MVEEYVATSNMSHSGIPLRSDIHVPRRRSFPVPRLDSTEDCPMYPVDQVVYPGDGPFVEMVERCSN